MRWRDLGWILQDVKAPLLLADGIILGRTLQELPSTTHQPISMRTWPLQSNGPGSRQNTVELGLAITVHYGLSFKEGL